MSKGDATFARCNCDWPGDPRCIALTSPAAKWFNHCLWLCAVKERRQTLPAHYTLEYLAYFSGLTVKQAKAALAANVDEKAGLIRIEEDGRITVLGVRSNHPKLSWRDSQPPEKKDIAPVSPRYGGDTGDESGGYGGDKEPVSDPKGFHPLSDTDTETDTEREKETAETETETGQTPNETDTGSVRPGQVAPEKKKGGSSQAVPMGLLPMRALVAQAMAGRPIGTPLERKCAAEVLAKVLGFDQPADDVLLRIWGVLIQAQGKDNSAAFVTTVLTNPKYPVADFALKKAKVEMRGASGPRTGEPMRIGRAMR